MISLQCSEKFGLHYVDFSDPERPRTQKESARYLASLAAANGFAESPAGPCTNGEGPSTEEEDEEENMALSIAHSSPFVTLVFAAIALIKAIIF